MPEALRVTVTREGAVRFDVSAKPRAREGRIAGVRDGALVVRLASPPVDGAANDELLSALASALGLPRRDVTLVRGESGRHKQIEVRGLSPEAVRARLEC